MTELFFVVAGAVFVGYILATIVLCAIMCNKFVVKFITKRAFDMTMKLYDEIEEDSMFKEKMEAY